MSNLMELKKKKYEIEQQIYLSEINEYLNSINKFIKNYYLEIELEINTIGSTRVLLHNSNETIILGVKVNSSLKSLFELWHSNMLLLKCLYDPENKSFIYKQIISQNIQKEIQAIYSRTLEIY